MGKTWKLAATLPTDRGNSAATFVAWSLVVVTLSGCGAEWSQISATQTAQAGGVTATPTPAPEATARVEIASPLTPTAGIADVALPLTPTEAPVASPTETPARVGAFDVTPPSAPTWTPTAEPIPTRSAPPASLVAVTAPPGEASTPGLFVVAPPRIAPRDGAPTARNPAPLASIAPIVSLLPARSATVVPARSGLPKAAVPATATIAVVPLISSTPAWKPPTLLAAPVGRTPTPSELLALGANRALRSPTFHYHVDASKAPLDLGTGLVVTTIDGDALEPDRSTLALTGTLLGMPTTMDVFDIHGKSYQRDPSGTKWQPMVAPIPLDIFGAERDIASGMAVARSPQQLVDVSIDGVPCHHVIAEVPSTTLTLTFGTALDGPPVRAEYWIATSDHTVRQVTLTGKITWDATTSTQVVTIVLRRIGEPVVFPNVPQ